MFQSRKVEEKKYFHYMAMPSTRSPAPGSWNNLDRPYLGHHYYTLSLPDLCLGVEKNPLKNFVFSLYDLYDHTLDQEPLPHGSWNWLFWKILTWSWMLLCVLFVRIMPQIEERRRFVNEIMNFHYMTRVWPLPSKRTPALGFMVFLGGGGCRHFLDHHYCTFFKVYHGVEKNILRNKYINITLFTPTLLSPWSGSH